MKLTSWNDFRRIFGGFLPYSYLAYAVRGFFASGGETCYVVRVGVAATPPATAFMPLPAAISSSLVAHLSSSVNPGENELSLDSPVRLGIGTAIAIGDPAVSQQLLRVADMSDAQTITLQIGLEAGHDAGEPVFKLSGPALGTPVTFIAAATTSGQTQIQVDTTELQDVAPGKIIAFGNAVTGECVSVVSVVDDQTVTVQPPLQSVHQVGEPVFPIPGSALTAIASQGDSVLKVASTDAFAEGGLLSIEGGGVSEVRNVVAVSSKDSTISLGATLSSPYPYAAGSVVRRYDAAITVSAYSAGAWGNGIQLEITPIDVGYAATGYAATRFSLRVTVDQGADPTQPQQQEFYPLLSLDPNDPSPSQIYAPQVVNQASQLIKICPGSENCPGVILQGTFLLVNAGPLQSGNLYLEGGSDGVPTPAAPAAQPAQNPCKPATPALAAMAANPYPAPPNVSNQDFFDALDVLGLIDEVAILCCPEAAGPPPPPQTPAVNPWSMLAIQQAMVEQCVRLQYRVAVLDTPQFQAGSTRNPLQPAAALNWLQGQYSGSAARFAAVYYPWLKVPDDLGIEGPNRTVPPCGHVAGAYAYTDNNFGVQKPPANVQLQFVSDVQLAVSNQQQAFLNPAGVNAIRAFPGRGIRVWGARSVASGSNPPDPDWIFIHTRRLMSMIEDSVEQASRWVVFQTNDDDLRRMLTHSLNVFLQSIWLTGGLRGARPTDGYFVKCDGTNNTQTTIDAGQLICQVGVAIAAPMEFLVFELRRSVAGAQVVEA